MGTKKVRSDRRERAGKWLALSVNLLEAGISNVEPVTFRKRLNFILFALLSKMVSTQNALKMIKLQVQC
jgi:hypothetical protein